MDVIVREKNFDFLINKNICFFEKMLIFVKIGWNCYYEGGIFIL